MEACATLYVCMCVFAYTKVQYSTRREQRELSKVGQCSKERQQRGKGRDRKKSKLLRFCWLPGKREDGESEAGGEEGKFRLFLAPIAVAHAASTAALGWQKFTVSEILR